jgi:cytochrome c oxidase assembly protein subunit 11
VASRTNNGANVKIISRLMIVVIGMFCFGFALVPLYDVFCKVTGINGKTGEQVTLSNTLQEDMTRKISVEFITTLNESMPWEFRSLQESIEVHPGKPTRVDFVAKNTTDHTMTGQAIPSVAPGLAAQYMHKTECFCFSQQTLAAGEEKLMPVIFYIDPEIPADIRQMTLSYTFFVTKGQGETSSKPLAYNTNHQEI